MDDAKSRTGGPPDQRTEKYWVAALAGIGFWTLDLESNELRSDLVPGARPGQPHPLVLQATDLLTRVHPDDIARLRRQLRRALASEPSAEVDVDTEFRVRRDDGGYTWLAMRGSVVRDSGGRPLKLSGVHFDIHQRKQAELATLQAKQALEEANRAKDGFLVSVSHEIRTPLTSIIGYAELLLQRSHGKRELSELTEILNSARHLEALVDDLLDLSRISAGKVAIDPQPVDVPGLLQEIESAMAIPAADAGLLLSTELEHGVPDAILTDGVRVRQVLTNLIGNAIKFTPEGEIHLSARSARIDGAACIVFTVRDTGPGIEAAQLARLFEPFNQAAPSGGSRQGGLGLGLAISQRLATLLGGKLEVESRVGAGSAFHLFLPATHIASPTDAGATRPVPDSGASSLRGRLLVAEEAPAMRRLLRECLTSAGADVVTVGKAEDLLEALEQATGRNRSFDVLLLNLQMGGLDLPALLAQADSGQNRLAVVGLTPHATRADRQNYLAMGLRDVVTMPFSPAQLRARVSNLLSDRRITAADQGKIRRTARALVVEDHESLAELTASQLRALGYDVEVAFSAAAAMDRARALRPNVIVVDLSLPDMDGVELCRTLYRECCPRGCRMLAYTGSQEPADHAALKAAGCVGVLLKPATKDQFRALLWSD